MSNPSFDSLDTMVCPQAFDSSTNIFSGQHLGDKTFYLGAMWVSEPMTGLGDGQVKAVQSALASPFPVGTVIQVGLLSAPDITSTIDDYREKKMGCEQPVLKELVKRQADLIQSGVFKPVVKASGVMLSHKRMIVTIKFAFEKTSRTNILYVVDQANKLESSLKANGMGLRRATASDYLEVTRLITHIYDKPDNRYDDTLAINEQVFYAGDNIEADKDLLAFKTGSSGTRHFYANGLSPKYLPKDFSLGLMNYAIGDPRGINNQVRHPYYMVLTLYYPDQLQKKAAIDKKAGWINHQLFGGAMSKLMPQLVLKKEGFDVLQAEIETNSAILVEASFTMWMFGKTQAEIIELNEDVRTYWASLGFEMRLEKVIVEEMFSQCMPLNASEASSKGLFRKHTLTSSQACQFLPVLGEWRGVTKPTMLLTTRRGEVGGFDLFKSNMNFNGILVAASGSGKSFVTQRLVTDYLAEGAKIWVIDSGRSYLKLAKAVGGTFIEFGPHSNIQLNPFTSFLPERGGGHKHIDDEMDMLSALLERMAAQRDPLDDLEIEILKKAIRQTFIENQGHTTIQNIADWLSAQSDDSRARDLALRLDSFAYGQYAKFFNGYSNVNMNNDFVVLELDDLKNQKQLQQVVLLQLVAQITNDMYANNGRKSILIIDEAWSLLDDPIMSRAMESAFRTARKYDSGILVVTQGIADLYKSKSGQSMIENASWQIVLQQKTEAIDFVYNNGQLNIDPYTYEQMKTLGTIPGSHSEMMIIGNGCSGIFRLTVDKFTQIMYSTSGRERSQILDDIDSGMDVIESIQQFIVGESAMAKLDDFNQFVRQLLASGVNKEELHRMMHNTVDQVNREVLAGTYHS